MKTFRILIPAYNPEKELTHLVQSLLMQASSLMKTDQTP